MATARSCSTSALRRTTVRSSSVSFATRCSAGIANASSPAAVPSRHCVTAEADGKREGVRIEALGLGQAQRGGADRGEAGGITAHERGALQEVEDAETGGEARAAAGRQHVVGAGNVVADRFRRVAAEKDGAG